MMDGTLETIDGRPALRFERQLAHSVERVWRAVSEPAELERWFPAAADWTPAAGETFEAGGATGEVTDVDAQHRLAWTFNGERYSFELAAHGSGCLLVFTHVFDDRALGAQHAAGWEVHFDRLDAHLEGRFMSELEAHEAFPEVHERYAGRFGLDPEVAAGRSRSGRRRRAREPQVSAAPGHTRARAGCRRRAASSPPASAGSHYRGAG
jgi:uncharacterized protein YndB with AHSA1/START domain